MGVKSVLILALLAVSIYGMSKEFKLGQNEYNQIEELANTSEFVRREELIGLFSEVIERTINNLNWSSENFPRMFAEEITKNILGQEVEIQGNELLKFLQEDKIPSIYQAYFKKIVSFLAKELSQEEIDLEENFENYSLSFDTYYILSYQIPKQI